MNKDFEKSFVCIYNGMQEVVGAGFLVNDKDILTCAHVVEVALELQETTSDPDINHRIIVVFPFIEQKLYLDTSVYADGWDKKKDIAVLQVHSALPEGTQPVELSSIHVNKLENHQFEVYGYPDMKGVWAHGTIGKQREHGLVQLESVNGKGYPVQEGFSGGPVFDKEINKVVGMLATADDIVRVSSMIPVEMLCDVYFRVDKSFKIDEFEGHIMPTSPIEICQKCLQESFTERDKDALIALFMAVERDIGRKLNDESRIDYLFNQIIDFFENRNGYDKFWIVVKKHSKDQYNRFYPNWKKATNSI